MTFFTRRGATAALALSGLLALGACGSSGDSREAGQSDSTSAAQGAKVDVGEVAQRMVAAMQKAGSGTMTIETDGQKATGDFRYVDGKLEQHTTLPVEGAEMEIIALGDFVYLKGLPGQEKPWVKIDPNASDPVSQMFKGIVEGGVSDPTKMADTLKGTQAKVTSGEGGTTTYEFTVDPAKALGQAASPSPSASGGAPLAMTYVLDEDDRPVTISTKLSGRAITVAYSDWGKKVDITAPPADQVGSMGFPSAG